jgi:hypothetical protein
MNERIRRITSIAIVACATALSASAQITDRPRPAEWAFHIHFRSVGRVHYFDKLAVCRDMKSRFTAQAVSGLRTLLIQTMGEALGN